MSDLQVNIRFAVLPVVSDDARMSEFARTLVPHPLAHQELPHEPQYTIYNRRLTAMRMSNGSADDAYWKI